MLARALMWERMDDAVEVFTRLHATKVRDAAELSGPREEKTTGG
jgi:hypothetical protein